MESNCVFCKIEPVVTKIISEGKWSYVAFSNPRLVPGHLLVIPKMHVETLSGLIYEAEQEIWSTIKEYQTRILAKGIGKGCDLRQNYRPFLEQSNLKVNHLHFHILPRTSGDELYQASMRFEKDVFKELSQEEFEKYSNLLKR